MLTCPSILFFVPYAFWGVHSQVDAVIAKAMALRGGKVHILRCNKLYAHCAAAGSGPSPCEPCMRDGDALFSKFDLPQTSFGSFISSSDRELAENWAALVTPETYATARYEALEIGDWALSTVLTHFRIRPESLSEPNVWKVAHRYLIDTLLTFIGFTRALEMIQPDFVFLFNGRLYPYRAAFEAARRRGLPTFVHDRGFVGDGFNFFENATMMATSHLRELYEVWKNVPMSTAELERVEAALEGRRTGKSLNMPSFYPTNVIAPDVLRWLDIPHNAKIVGVFTSSQDEAFAHEGYGPCAQQLELLDHIFEVFRDRDEYVVVRHHPNIGGGGIDIPETDMMSRYYKQALRTPKRNVRIVQPGDKLTSYDIIPYLSYAFAPFSSIVFELTSAGVISAPFHTTPHAGAFSHVLRDITTKSVAELVDQMSAAGSSVNTRDLSRMYRYFHAVHHELSFEFKSFGLRNSWSPDIRVTNLADLSSGQDPCLDHIWDRVSLGTPLYPYPQVSQRMRNDADERVFFEAKLQCMASRLGKRKQSSGASRVPLVPVAAVRVRGRRAIATIRNVDGWLERSHHPDVCSEEIVDMENEPACKILRWALSLPAVSNAEYVLFYPEGIQYDGSALVAAADALAGVPAQSAVAVILNGWVSKSGRRRLLGLDLHKRSAREWRQYVKFCKLFRDPVYQMALAVWRRDALGRFLHELPIDIADHTFAERLADLLSDSTKVLRLEQPLFMVHGSHDSSSLTLPRSVLLKARVEP